MCILIVTIKVKNITMTVEMRVNLVTYQRDSKLAHLPIVLFHLNTVFLFVCFSPISGYVFGYCVHQTEARSAGV